MILNLRSLAGLVLVLIFCGCALTGTDSQQTSPPSVQSAKDSPGYALLSQLLGDEKDVSKLLIIKRERVELRELVRQISETAGRAHRQLENFARADRSLNLKDQRLPTAELQTRQAISKTQGKELLTESGKEFEVRMLLTQREALTYGGHLAAAVANNEANQQRAQFLRQLSSDLNNLQRRVAAMLVSNYSWPQK